MALAANAVDVFAEIVSGLKGEPAVERLREARDILDDPAFVAELIREIKTINDPDVLSDLLARIRRLRRDMEERRDKKLHNKEMIVQMGVAGGVGLVGGSIVAAAAATFPLIVLLPVVGGALMAFMGYRSASKLDGERHLYEQLAEQMNRICEEVQ